MKEFIEKLIGRLEERQKVWTARGVEFSHAGGTTIVDERAFGTGNGLYEAIQIVIHLSEEHNNANDSMEIQIAKNYAKWITMCGVNVTEKWETATTQAYALNKAYMRGRQDERDKFAEWQDNNGWIPCKERLPENNKVVLCWVVSTTIASGETFIIGSCDCGFWFLQTYEIGHHHFPVKDYEVVAWQPLPAPYREGGAD